MRPALKLILPWFSILVGFILLWKSPPLPVNYQHLENSLASGDFKQADLITRNVISVLASRENVLVRTIHSLFEPVYFPTDLDRISCENLIRIDQLWRNYSDGRFGFTAQQQIWNKYYDLNSYQFAGDISLRRRKFLVLARYVGWVGEKEYYINANHYQHLTFNLTAPSGHLPSWLWTAEESRSTPHEEYKYNFLFQRMQSCISEHEAIQ